MRIAASSDTAAALAAQARARDGTTVEAADADLASRPAAPASTTVAPLQTAVIQPALRALRAMPDDIDPARVAELRDAIARGEVSFDAARLAGLIQRFHGSIP